MPRTIKTLSFKGGYRFRGFGGVPTEALKELEPGKTATIALEPGTSSIVNQGDSVTTGAPVAEAENGPQRSVVSPTSGTVTEITDSEITINSAGDQSWSAVEGSTQEWENLTSEKIGDVLLATGSCCVSPGGVPTQHKTSDLSPDDVRRVVVHDWADDVYSDSTTTLLAERSIEHLIEGIGILGRLYPNAELHVALGRGSSSLLIELEKSVGTSARFYEASPKYPQSLDAVLLGALVDESVPPNPTAADYGAVMFDIQGLLQVRDAVIIGKPYIDRVIALAGPGFSETPHLRVRIGTPAAAVVKSRVIEGRSPRIVINSVMTGTELADDASVGCDWRVLVAVPKTGPELLPFAKPGFRADSISLTFAASFIKFSKTIDDNLHGEERACLSCGFCTNVCPAGILPYHLQRFAGREIIDERLVRYGAFRCIDCNLCTYVCPSKIPVAKLIHDGKQALLAEGYSPTPAVASEEAE